MNFKNHQILRDWSIFVYHHPYPDIFTFRVKSSNTLRIYRTDGGWWLDLKLYMVNNVTSEKIVCDVGKNSTNVKDVIFENNIFEQKLPSNVFSSDNIPDINTKDIIISIPSVINVCECLNRSLISNNDRYNQTLEQLKTIKKYIPNSTTILQETSYLQTKQILELSKLCDYIILYNNDNSHYYTHQYIKNKGLGELYVLLDISRVIRNKNFKYFFKFGGRYKLSDNFTINKFIIPYPTFSCIKGKGRLGILTYSNLYSIPKKYYNLYIEHINVWLSKTTDEPVEHILTMFAECIKKIKIVNKLGIEGYGAGTKKYNIL